MENLDLQEIRKKLDGIDNQLVELFEKRMALCSDVAEFKIQTGKKGLRWGAGTAEIRLCDWLWQDSEFNKKGVYELFSQIMTISRKLQYGLLIRHGQALGNRIYHGRCPEKRRCPHCLSGSGRLLWTWGGP